MTKNYVVAFIVEDKWDVVGIEAESYAANGKLGTLDFTRDGRVVLMIAATKVLYVKEN